MIDFNVAGKPPNIDDRNNDMNEVEEQFENIELNQDSTETLPMENMLGLLRAYLVKNDVTVCTN